MAAKRTKKKMMKIKKLRMSRETQATTTWAT